MYRIGFSVRKFLILTGFFFCFSTASFAVMPHKTFLIKSYQGMDVLCGPYTVQKDDYIWDILKRKGVLSKKNFPKFLAMFKQLNSHIPDPDRIYPGQHIIIPLKYVKSQGATKSPSSITIPVIPDILYYDYRVRSGDSISTILARHYDVPVSNITQQQLQLFKRINPDIKNINMIYPGQYVQVPELKPTHDLSKEQAPQIASVEPQKLDEFEPAQATVQSGEEDLSKDKGVLPIKDEGPRWSRVVVSEALKPLGGDLISNGSYFFPSKDGTEHILDLAAYPIVELKDGQRVLLDIDGNLSDPIKKVLNSFWKDLKIAKVDQEVTTQSVLEKIIDTLGGSGIKKGESVVLSDGISVTLRGDWVFSRKHGATGELMYLCVTVINHPEEGTPKDIQRYLARKGIHVIDILSKKENRSYSTPPPRETKMKGPAVITIDAYDKKAFVSKLFDELGVTYTPDTAINVSYAGFDVELSVNLATTAAGTNLIVDFGAFYGDIASVLTERGIKALTVSPKDKILTVAKSILEPLDIPFTESPLFFAANRGALRTVSLTIPGTLISRPEETRIFLTPIRLHPSLSSFLKNKSIKVLRAYKRADKEIVKARKKQDKI
jgi:hypothetical protein